ncbi:MAG TPA: hypothetical protein VNN80_02410 [Polyangiaceae bacterium]|nr:hypothetical protein [Polyangiaceae bacterium]
MTKRSALAGLCAAGLALAGSGCNEPSAYIMSMMHALGQGSEGEAGYSCTQISSGGSASSGGDVGNNLWVHETTDGNGLSVEIGSFDRVLEQRHYDREFSQSHSVDQFVVTSANGTEYEFVYWGGDECEPCPPAPYEAPAGDAFGCDAGGAVSPSSPSPSSPSPGDPSP